VSNTQKLCERFVFVLEKTTFKVIKYRLERVI